MAQWPVQAWCRQQQTTYEWVQRWRAVFVVPVSPVSWPRLASSPSLAYVEPTSPGPTSLSSPSSSSLSSHINECTSSSTQQPTVAESQSALSDVNHSLTNNSHITQPILILLLLLLLLMMMMHCSQCSVCSAVLCHCIILHSFLNISLQCSDNVCWVTGRTSGL